MMSSLLAVVLAAQAASNDPLGPELPQVSRSDSYGPAVAPVSDAATAPTTDAARAERLLGAAAEPSAPDEPSVGGGLRAWSIPAGIGGLAIAGGLARRRRGAAPGVAPMQVVQRIALGDKNFLVIVDVPDCTGAARRLVVGTGSGSPTLVSDLGELPGAVEAAVPAGAPALEAVVAVEAPRTDLPTTVETPAGEPFAAAVADGPTDRELGAPRLSPLPGPSERAPMADDSASAAFFGERRGDYFTEADLAPLPPASPAAESTSTAARVAARLMAASRAARLPEDFGTRARAAEPRRSLKELAQRGTELAGLVPESRGSAMAARVYVPFAVAGSR